MEVELPNLLWYGNNPRMIELPDNWDVEVLDAPGFHKPAVAPAAIADALANPIGCPTLRELAEGAERVAIVFDDMTRPTPVSDIVPFVLAPLKEAGVPDDDISFIPALGMHGALTNMEYRKKLGDAIVRKYPIYNHNPYDNCDYVGDTGTGLPVWLNREYLACDLRIGIGSITPHVHAGFGGGGKLILPGISGIETITGFHRDVQMRDPASTGLGRYDGNEMSAEIKRVTKMAGMAMKIDVLLNSHGGITDVFAGDPLEEYEAGVAVAKEHYATRSVTGCDIVIVNAYGKYNEMGICMIMALNCVNFDRGTIVLIVDAPEGQVCHYLFRSFGKGHGGRLYFPRTTMPTGTVPEGLECIVMSAYHDRTMCDLFAPIGDVQLTDDWDQTLALLEKRFGERARVAVVPDGTMQYYTDPWT